MFIELAFDHVAMNFFYFEQQMVFAVNDFDVIIHFNRIANETLHFDINW